jgi:hypothetical protein
VPLRRYFNNAEFVCYGAFDQPDCDVGPPQGLEALLVAVNVITCATVVPERTLSPLPSVRPPLCEYSSIPFRPTAPL